MRCKKKNSIRLTDPDRIDRRWIRLSRNAQVATIAIEISYIYTNIAYNYRTECELADNHNRYSSEVNRRRKVFRTKYARGDNTSPPAWNAKPFSIIKSPGVALNLQSNLDKFVICGVVETSYGQT